MTLLLDTHTFLWAILDDPALSDRVRGQIETEAERVFVSVASFWEIAIKFGLGKLPLPEEPDHYLPAQQEAAGFERLLVDAPEVCQVHRLPPHHRDPFDRLLVAQANCHGMVIATDDDLIRRYPVQTTW